MSDTTSRGITVRDIKAADFIKAYAQHIKRSGKIELPKWVDYAKTAPHRELAPYDPDWYFIRTAAIARKVYLRQNIGVGSLTKAFGTAGRRGARPQHHYGAAPGIIRHMLHSLEKLKVVETADSGVKKGGRRITKLGQQDLDRIAAEVARDE